MRVPVLIEGEIGDSFDRLSPREKRQVLSQLRDSILCESLKSFKEFSATAVSSETKAAFQDLKDYICWVKLSEKPKPAPVAALAGDLLESIFSEPLLQTIQRAKDPLRSEEPRDKGFARKFEPLFAYATRIELVDKWAATDLMKGNEGARWFTSKFLKLGQGTLSLISEEPSREGNFLMPLEDRRQLVVKRLSAMLKEEHGFLGSVRMTLVPQGFLQHNRRIAFRFDSGQATSVVEHGLSTFDRDPFVEAHEFPNADLIEFKKLVARVSGISTEKKFEFALNHRDTCIDCSAG